MVKSGGLGHAAATVTVSLVLGAPADEPAIEEALAIRNIIPAAGPEVTLIRWGVVGSDNSPGDHSADEAEIVFSPTPEIIPAVDPLIAAGSSRGMDISVFLLASPVPGVILIVTKPTGSE